MIVSLWMVCNDTAFIVSIRILEMLFPKTGCNPCYSSKNTGKTKPVLSYLCGTKTQTIITMDFSTYTQYFQDILTNPQPDAPYDKPDYFNYTKLNWSRTNRWLKHGELLSEVKEAVSSITNKQNWIVITEPWCGDAAHIVPFIHLISELNPLISIDYELRDSEPFRINEYLTNGGKSIPKLIIRDEDGNDLATWGPRPSEAQLFYDELKAKNANFEEIKTELQKWYNENHGVAIQQELSQLFKSIPVTH